MCSRDHESGARFVIAGTDTNYVLAGARQDTNSMLGGSATTRKSRALAFAFTLPDPG